MDDIALRVEHLSKKYRIRGEREVNTTLRDVFAGALVHAWQYAGTLFGRKAAGTQDIDTTFWALQEVSFEVKRGEVVGIIGRNGAGKSTLLKILSRITEPTVGYADVFGRVGSLLEVGTGFHPELTGRENLYLNGAILGMKRAEIARKFDEIVAFAEIERFIDTPVKHYSSGMYMRLAFAVAAHLEPEILLVDEVLAVGDAQFQKKCLNKMQDVGKQGRTVLFVSHNMPAITRLCARALLLEDGHVRDDGIAHRVVSAYLNAQVGTTAAREWPEPEKSPGGEVARLRGVRVHTQEGQTTESVDIRYPVGIEMQFDVCKAGYVLSPYFDFYNEENVLVFAAADLDPTWRKRSRPVGRFVSTAWIPGNLLSEGTIIVGAGLAAMNPTVTQFYERDVVAFHVIDSMEGDAARGDWAGPWGGAVRPRLHWTTQCAPQEVTL